MFKHPNIPLLLGAPISHIYVSTHPKARKPRVVYRWGTPRLAINIWSLVGHVYHLWLGQFPRRFPVLLRTKPSPKLLVIKDCMDSFCPAVFDIQRGHPTRQGV